MGNRLGFQHGVEHQQDGKREHQQKAGQPVGFAILQRFDMIVDLHRHDAGFTGNVAADHQHHAEFADSMGKA